MSAVEDLIGELSPVCAGLPDRRKGPRCDGAYTMADIALSAFSVFFMGHKQVLPLPPEFIAPQDGAGKQDCERNAAQRWLAKHGAGVAPLRPVFPGDDLFARQPIAAAIHDAGGTFILTCKPASHKTIEEYLHGADPEEHREAICKRGTRTTAYRWLNAVPLRAMQDAATVNWVSVEIFNAKGKRTCADSFVTDLAVTRDTIAELLACGRARWKIPARRRMASRGDRPPPCLTLLRASPHHHGLRRVSGLDQPSSVRCSRRGTATVTRPYPYSHKPTKPSTPKP